MSSLASAIVAARSRLAPYIRVTPCAASTTFSRRLEGDVWLKCEHLQHTGSFKARGALHKLLCLTPAERARGVVTASSGNHGAGVAWAAHTLGVRALVFVPEGASTGKVEKIKGYGSDVRTHGTDGLDTEMHARNYATQQGSIYVSPYNDLDVVAGQGTIGVELCEQMGRLDAVVIAVGGGGLIAGVAAYLNSELPNVRVIAAQPENSAVMTLSMQAGHVVEAPSKPTLSDGTAGGVEAGSVTFDLCRDFVDDWVLVSEKEIAEAMRDCIADEHQLIEGSAGVALAALKHKSEELRGRRAAVILCGGNVSLPALRTVFCA